MSSGLFHCPGVRREFWDFPAALRFFVPSRVPLNCPDTRCLVQTPTLVVIPGRWGCWHSYPPLNPLGQYFGK